MVKIIPYKPIYQSDIDEMMIEISTEFATSIFTKEASKSKPILDGYWIAFYNDELVGTIAILKIQDSNSILNRMFVKKEFRGKAFQVAHLLLQKLFAWCNNNGVKNVLLGTMNQFKAAHKFYEKNGFHKIDKDVLPRDFKYNSLDDVFYFKKISFVSAMNLNT